jgi:hypothetical protein
VKRSKIGPAIVPSLRYAAAVLVGWRLAVSQVFNVHGNLSGAHQRILGLLTVLRAEESSPSSVCRSLITHSGGVQITCSNCFSFLSYSSSPWLSDKHPMIRHSAFIFHGLSGNDEGNNPTTGNDGQFLMLRCSCIHFCQLNKLQHMTLANYLS